MWEQGSTPEVKVGGHAFEDVSQDIRASEDARAVLVVVIFVVIGGVVAGGLARAGRAVLTLAVVALQVVFETGRLGAGVVTMRAPVGFLSCVYP